MSSSKTNDPTVAQIPPGFSKQVFDGREFIVPNMMIPHTHQAFAAYQAKEEMNVVQTKHKISKETDIHQDEVAGGLFSFPPIPNLSDQEKLSLHAEVIALQKQLGISYRDASHCLYMAEVEKLKLADKNAKAWANLAMGITEALKDMAPDEVELDNEEEETEPVAETHPEAEVIANNAEHGSDGDYEPESGSDTN